MVILGIDPGYGTVGYGVIDYAPARTRAIGYGAITTRPGSELALRLAEIYADMNRLLDHYRPDAVAMEELFFNKNITTGIQVAQARGVLMLACAQRGLTVNEYSPSQVKQAVVGYGKAEKHQMMELTRTILRLEKIPRPDDAADALAIALCHGNTAGSLLAGR